MGVAFAVGGINPGSTGTPTPAGTSALEARLVPALQTVFHDGEYPSHVSLPFVPRE